VNQVKTYSHSELWKEDVKFKTLLGEFVMLWADTESWLYLVLRRYAKISDAVARSIFSGTRAKNMIDYMRAIMHNTHMSESRKSDLEFVFCQISAINTTRDRVMHFSSGTWWKWDESAHMVLDNSER
jgi:hypothetical protein